VAYNGLYAGIDLVTWGQRDSLKYEFHVAPGADYQQIRIHYDGIKGLSIDAQGVLHVQTALGDLTDAAPMIYQQIGGRQVPVAGQFKLLDADTYTFVITGPYDPTRELVIDPDLAWSTYLGGSGDYGGGGIAVDAADNVYVTGDTSSIDFPTTAGAIDTTFSGSIGGVFVAKIDPSGSGLVYWTYLGGNGQSTGIAVDAAGNAYVTGTALGGFPTTPGALETTWNVGYKVFVTKLNASGSGLVYSTYLGGSGNDESFGIAVDASGNAYVTGGTNSIDFPTTAGALDTTYNDGYPTGDAFVAKLNASGSALVYSTYLGGSGDDEGNGIAVDAGGNAYVTGWTESSDFPTTVGALDTTYNGGDDAFVAKLNANGSGLVYSTYLGGSGDDLGCGIAVDEAGNAYVTGSTWSIDFPTTAGALDTTSVGSGDAFVANLNANGSGLIYSTYLGGSGDDVGSGIAVDAVGDAYVTGITDSNDFPTTAGSLDTTYQGSDFDGCAFVTMFNSSGDQQPPTVSGITPSAGPVSGGTTVTITGSGLTGAILVDFGTRGTRNFVVNSDSQITVTSPNGSQGTVDVAVINVGGGSARSSADQFTYIVPPPPMVSRVSPSAGATIGGTIVTITGSNLTGAKAVDFGVVPASNYVIDSDSQVTATSPAGALGTVDVTVTTLGGDSVTSPADRFAYIYVAPPAVSRISPSVGPDKGGTTVIITGSHLSGATAVDFGTYPVRNFVVNSNRQITATSPEEDLGGIVDVTVTTAGGTSHTLALDRFTYLDDDPPTSAYTPVNICGAYGIDAIRFSSNSVGLIKGTGAGQTIAIVDAYDDPDLVSSTSPNFSTSDLADFDAQFGLPDPPSFLKLDENGGTDYPPPDPKRKTTAFTWESEECMDVEWAHAIAPQANIVLIETNSSSLQNLFAGVRTAAALPGVSVVSMSWGGAEFSGEQTYDSKYLTTPKGHAGVTFVASSGDDGSPGDYPAYSPNVLAVGGTTMCCDEWEYVAETAWSPNGKDKYSSGGGKSQYEKEPSYQDSVQKSGKREIPDVAFDADPATGVAVYDSYDLDEGDPWIQAGGTSLGAPCWAGLIAIADQLRVAQGGTTLDGPTQTLPYLYQLAQSFLPTYHDITSGNNGKYKAGPGYDMVTGLGSPVADYLVPELAAMGLPGVTAVSKASSPAAGAATVTLTGANLGSATEIPFGTVPVAQFLADTATQIEFSPAFAAGTADIQGLAEGDTPAVTSQDDFADTGTGVASQDLRLGVESSRPGSRAHVRHEVGLSSPDSTDAALLSMLDEWQTAT
jgi:hypothetical protein